ncbi:putative E3 ubiquitin-protein ligase LIN-1 isoform X2 [Durio zibethinus]|uniref:RING-type E3 ubiquitin transferase n=1 Tax=Durio zibethinus TaxID=66656 RepID=A0A6P6ARI6_DURZI|nr:putative E3 ubiquitin-protein ligase LIN-1 isoform X2 [Durio zibethinus]
MAGNYRFAMDQKEIVRALITTVGSFSQDRLINKEQRIQHKEQCAERLAAEDGSTDKDIEVRYSDQAVLANLDWGIEALEEAIETSNMETKNARLDYAEKMLQVCAMLTSDHKTAGVPNSYLSAWAHLNLSYLWKLRNNVRNSVLHVLEMFIIDPFFSRIDFAPELWKELFLPHMSSIVGWYSEARQRLMMEVIPDSSDLSFTTDFDQFFNESLIFSMRPDQVENLKKLEQLYGESLDENTRLFAKYYKDCINSDSTANKKVMAPMLPIAEPPMTPLHEVSRSIPDYVKFGPILPKSAGFSPVLKSKHGKRVGNNRMSATSSAYSLNMDESAAWDPDDGIPEENEDDSDYEPNDASIESEDQFDEVQSSKGRKMTSDKEIGTTVQPTKLMNQTRSPSIYSPVDSPKTSSSKNSSPKPDVNSKKESKSFLRLLSCRITDSSDPTSLPIPNCKSNDHSISSEDSDGEVIEMQKSCRKNRGRPRSMSYDHVNIRTLENSSQNESNEGNHSCVALPLSEKLTPQSRPPKDFVCPITGQIFNDPVTLETGQTYERKAIEEWLNRGNATCPITRHPLSSSALPKTNYVLKRLITSWKEQHPDIAQEFSYSETPRNSFSSPLGKEIVLVSPSTRATNISNYKGIDDYVNQRGKRFTRAAVATSPTSVISQAAVETIINGLKPFVSCLCTSNNLQECESAVLAIARLWKDSKGDVAVHSYLSKPTIVNGFVEILSASLDREVLRTSIYILSELIFTDENVGETLTSVDSDFDCLAALLKNGLSEAAVLIYQLRPTFAQLSFHDLVPSLVQIILHKNEESDDLLSIMEPKDAAIAMLEQMLMGGDENSRSFNALSVVSANVIPSLVKFLDRVEGRRSIISILLCCMKVDKSCRNLIANGIELSYVLELLHAGNDSIRGICIDFLSELVQLNRRTLSNQILQIIRTEGAFSTMHTFLVYLQMAPMEHQPTISTLLLQLDLLAEPRKMSIYREEAIEALIEALRRKDFPNQQMIVLQALLSLPGRLISSGESYIEAWLLKIAGFDQPYNALIKADYHEKDLTEMMEEEEKAACSWEKRVAFVLCNHEKGSIFKALEECFKSNSLKMAKSCLVIATWLTYMLVTLPDTGLREAARESLLDEFINVLQSSKNLEEKILAALALKTFINDPAALEELGKCAKCIYKTLRKLKRNSFVAADILKALMNLSSVNATELWSCTDVVELDSSANGEVLCMLHLKGCLISSHSDGTIKVWDAGKRGLRLVQEVHEHMKAVTCLYVPASGDRLYSGSLDKTIRVWALKPEEIHCIQVHDVKEAVYELTANAKFACFISQGNGVKVYNWSGIPKHINFNKHVKCIAMAGDKLYFGCSGYIIQELDLCSSTLSTFHSGTRKLLGKQTVNSLNIHDDLLYAGGSAVDGIAGKVFCRSSKAVMGSFSTGFDIQRTAVNNDFIFTATKCGIIEVWLKERINRVASIKVGSKGHAKITSLVSDMDGGMLYAGSSDGKIQVSSYNSKTQY